jgi:hypothetical protein
MANNRRVSPVYNICETKKARSQLDRLAGRHADFTALWESLVWLIQRTPTVGVLVTGKQATYVIKSEDFAAVGLPIVLVIYAITDTEKMIIEIAEIIEMAEEAAISGVASIKPA